MINRTDNQIKSNQTKPRSNEQLIIFDQQVRSRTRMRGSVRRPQQQQAVEQQQQLVEEEEKQAPLVLE